jgi:hypothetical protein
MFLSIIFTLACKNESGSKSLADKRDCNCPMPEIYDKSENKDSSMVESKDFYDWNVNGSISTNLKKIIDSQVASTLKSGKNKYEISATTVLNQVRNDYPELIDKVFEFKIKRLLFCTYHNIICSDTSLSESKYRELMKFKLTEFENAVSKEIDIKKSLNKNIFNKTDGISIDNRSISAEIYTEHQSGGSNTVNKITQITSASYQMLSDSLKDIVDNKLNLFSKKYKILNTQWISIEIESGSTIRRKVAIDLDALLSSHSRNWSFFDKTSISSGRFPDAPISIFCAPNMKPIARELMASIEPYILGEISYVSMNSWGNRIKIYINGNPLFDREGKVTVQ